MARLYIGTPPIVGRAAGVKVMKNNTDDPETTPNNHYGKFLFNSETDSIGYLNEIWTETAPASQSPSGSYPWQPMIENRVLKSGRFSAGNGTYTFYGSAGTRETGRHETFAGYYMHPDWANPGDTLVRSVWELPIGNAAIGLPVATPVVGQENFRFSPSLVRVARPGFSVASASGRQLVLDSTRIPAKILKAGEIRINKGTNVSINTGYALDVTTYMDWNWHVVGQAKTWPPPLTGAPSKTVQIGLTYSVSGSTVTIYNDGDYDLMLTYMICADSDDKTPSTGGSEWMRKIGDDWQIKRPGSSDTSPKLSDIMLDTRMAYIPLVEEGYLAASQFNESPTSTLYGEIAKTVSFVNTGFRPFVKYVVQTDSTNPILQYMEPRSQVHRIYFGTSFWAGRQARAGSVALISDTSVKFHIAPDNPAFIDPANPAEGIYTGVKVAGIRYYIFGIPTSL